MYIYLSTHIHSVSVTTLLRLEASAACLCMRNVPYGLHVCLAAFMCMCVCFCALLCLYGFSFVFRSGWLKQQENTVGTFTFSCSTDDSVSCTTRGYTITAQTETEIYKNVWSVSWLKYTVLCECALFVAKWVRIRDGSKAIRIAEACMFVHCIPTHLYISHKHIESHHIHTT